MSYAQASLTPRPSQAVPVSPFPGDVVVIETVNATMFPTLPEFGAPHPNSSKYPNHRFGWAGDPLQNGSQPLYYVADRQSQHLYNWETDNSSEWPRVVQSFVILRDEFDVNSRDYAPPPPDAIDCSEYQITQVQQRRMDDQRFDSLFVRVNVVRENIIEPLRGITFDSETGILVTTEKQKVPAGTPGSGISSDGTYSTIEPINSAWSIRTTRKAAGIVAQASGGTATRTYPIVVNYSWPAVLGSVRVFFPTLKSGGLGPAIVRPIWWKDAYNGPCVAEVVETWTLTQPTATLGQTMNPGDIEWNGLLFSFRASNILHRGMSFYETPGTNHPTYAYYYQQQYYGATTPGSWPTYVTSQIDVRPYFGGWLKREIRVYNPHFYTLSSSLVLGLSNVDSRSATVQWATGVAGPASVFIKQSGDANYTAGPNNLTTPSYDFTSLSPGTIYLAYVNVGSLTSNILTFTTLAEVPVINSDLSPITATRGTPISNRTVTAIGGGTMTYTASGLITGLTFVSGVLAGTPTSTDSGIYNVDVTASNSVGSVTETIVITYSAPPVITSSLTATASQGTAFSYTIFATNTPTSYSVLTSPLPTGLSFNATTRVISGTPTDTASTTWNISIIATNAAGFDTKTLVVTYTAKPIINASQTFTRPHSTFNVTPATVLASNSPTHWNVHLDPDGFFSDHFNMELNSSTGVISGDTSAPHGTYTISLEATNDAGTSPPRSITFTIDP